VVKTKKGSKWQLKDRKFLWESQTTVCSTALNKSNNILVVGFSTGIFALYEMPGCIKYVCRLS
jgi:periodic tryptophan protein 2